MNRICSTTADSGPVLLNGTVSRYNNIESDQRRHEHEEIGPIHNRTGKRAGTPVFSTFCHISSLSTDLENTVEYN